LSNLLNIDLIIFIVFSTLIVFLAAYVLKLSMRKRRLILEIVQLQIDKQILTHRLKEEIEKRNSADIENTDGFLKFISQSRDWAFDYIEQVQAALLEFKNKVEPQILYAKTYGTTVGESTHSIIVDKISDAYDDLVKVMPENSADNVIK
jgi:hypothetical protein